jgi:hypothetical protein
MIFLKPLGAITVVKAKMIGGQKAISAAVPTIPESPLGKPL